MSKLVKIYKGGAFIKEENVSTEIVKKVAKSAKKTITFDLDETLGSFSDLYILWRTLEPIMPDTRHDIFRELLDMFPEFLRYGIFNILDFLRHKKETGECCYVLLYTNNQCEDGWAEMIVDYLTDRLGYPLFDKIISAYKKPLPILACLAEESSQGKEDDGVECKKPPLRTSFIRTGIRTTHSKTYNDLIRCTMLSRGSEMCFVDNTYHDKMAHDRVYYIQPKSYQHALKTTDIISRFISKWTMFPLPTMFEATLYSMFAGRRRVSPNIETDLLVSQKIMYHLKEYFLLSIKAPKTRKVSFSFGRFTRKKV
jgi:hypothetical protein